MKARSVATIMMLLGTISSVGPATIMSVTPACAQPRKMSFREDIQPILKGYCVSCHQPGGQGYEASGVDLTSYAGLMKGTKFGRVVVPGDPDGSTLIALVYGRASPKIRMPYGHKPLPSCLKSNIWSWIFEGAKDN